MAGQVIKNIMQANIVFRVLSLIIGYTLWLILSQNIVITQRFELPVSFYNLPDNIKIEAPETVIANLKSTKSILSNIDNLAFYIDGNNLKFGSNIITLSSDNLYTPNIKLESYNPAQIKINMVKDESNK